MESQLRPPEFMRPSASFTHGSSPAQSHKNNSRSTEPFAAVSNNNDQEARRDSWNPFLALHHHTHSDSDGVDKPDSRHHRHHRHHDNRHLGIDASLLDRGSSKSPHRRRHKYSKSRDGRLPRTMSQIASSTGARALLPTWSGGKEKDRDGNNDGLLRPFTRETRWGSDLTNGLGSASRKSSLISASELSARAGPVRQQEIRSMEELEQVRRRRKQGEKYLRSSFTSIGTLATDFTRQLDYTYYNLLERLAALNSTISSFQELSDSTSALSNDFERESTGLDQEIRKQLEEFKGFDPQSQKVLALEERMRAGKKKVEELSTRLEIARSDIDDWEKREHELQIRNSRRLRIFWTAVAASVLVLVLAVAIRSWQASEPSPAVGSVSQAPTVSSTAGSQGTVAGESMTDLVDTKSQQESSRYPSDSASQTQTSVPVTSSSDEENRDTSPANQDLFIGIFDEL